MTIHDPIADLLTRIRNAQCSGLRFVEVPFSKIKKSLLDVLTIEGYIEGYYVENKSSSICFFVVFLKYFKNKPVVKKIRRLSKLSVRVYRSSNQVPRVLGGLGITILTTPFGVMSCKDATKLRCGGELLCTVE